MNIFFCAKAECVEKAFADALAVACLAFPSVRVSFRCESVIFRRLCFEAVVDQTRAVIGGDFELINFTRNNSMSSLINSV